MDKRLNANRRIDTGRELLVLGIVRRRPLSAYEIDSAVRNHTALYRGLGQGNIYHFVTQLADAGYLLSRNGRAKRGPAASKLVYHLSARGEELFQSLLRGLLHDTEASDSALEIGLVLLGQLPREEGKRVLLERSVELTAQLSRLKRLFGDPEERSGPANLASSHALYRLQMEQRFIRDMLRLLENSRWHPEWN